ncbi:MAG: chloride channel protein, partial [Chitinophagaceae bacterium]
FGMAALVGMAAMFAGASRALLTAVVFVIETTGEINSILPVFATSIVAYFISFFLMKGSIMTEKIKRRGVKTPDSLEPDVLQTAFVKQLATPVFENPTGLPFVYEGDDVGFAAEMMGKYHTDRLAVKENKHTLKTTGIITSASILSYYSSRKQKEYTYHSPGKVKRLLVHGRKMFIKTDNR